MGTVALRAAPPPPGSGPEDLRLVLDGAPDAFVAMDAAGRLIEWNRAAALMFGWSREEALGRPMAELIVPPGSHDALDRHLALGGEELVGRRLELVAVRRDGGGLAVELTMSFVRLEGRRCLSAFLRDVTARQRADERLREAEARFAGAFAAAEVGMAIVSPDGGWLAVNPALCRLLCRSERELLATDFQSLTHPDDLDPDLELLAQLVDGRRDRYSLEKRYLRPDGGLVWGLLSVSVVRDATGAPLHFVAQVQDIADRKTVEGELRRYTEALASLSGQDAITGLHNERALHAALAEELRHAETAGRSVSVVVALADPAGLALEARLLDVAEALRGVSREDDVVARLGPSAFALMLPDTSSRAARSVAARVRRALAGVGAEVGWTTGVAARRRGDGPEALLARAGSRAAEFAPAPDAPTDARPAAMVGDRVERVLRLATEQLDVHLAFLAEFREDDLVFRGLVGEAEAFGLREDDTLPLHGSYCAGLVAGRVPAVVPDARALPAVRDLPVTRDLGIGAYVGAPVRLADGSLYGTLCALDRDPRPDLDRRSGELLAFLAALLAEQIEEDERTARARREQVELAGVRTLLGALEARDFYTGEHSKTVVSLALAVAGRLGLDPDERAAVEQVALLHDVGKVGIPDCILQKQGPLDADEWQLMRQHPVVGERIVAGAPGLAHLAPAVRAEHERWDGGGYPDGLRGDEIPIASRITLACDAYHAMTSDRPYRLALSPDSARRELGRHAGSQFDPRVVAALLGELEGRGERHAPIVRPRGADVAAR